MTKWYQGNNSRRGEVQSYQQTRQYEAAEQERTILAVLERIEKLLKPTAGARLPLDQSYTIGNTQSNLYLDYKGRKHLYIYSAVALTLQLNDIGTYSVPATTWTDISFREGIQIFTTNQATAVQVYVKATDETISGATGGSSGLATNVNIQQVGGSVTPAGELPVNISQIGGVSSVIGTPADNVGNPTNIPFFEVYPMAWNGSQWTRALNSNYNTDNNNANDVGLIVKATTYGYNGQTGWDRLRVPNIFKTTTATTTGDNALWTPTGGKKFRLMGFLIAVTANAAISGGGALFEIILRDGTSPLGIGFSMWVPTTTVTTTEGGFTSGWCMLGNGALSAAANNVLNLNLSATLTSGEVRADAIGTEE